MTVPAAPLPSLRSILRAIRTPFDFRNSLWADDPRRLYLFGSGRTALAGGIEGYRRVRGGDSVRIWWPGYICVEALAGFSDVPVSFEFYRLRPDLTPDWERLGPVPSAEHGELQVLVLVHYFGFPSDTTGARRFADEHRMLLVEDAAHLLGMTPGIGSGDMLVFSPWKLLPVPSGGGLVTDAEVAEDLETSGRGDAAGLLGWMVVRFLQRALRRLGISWHGFLGFTALRHSLQSNITPNVSNRMGRFVAHLLQVESQEAERVRENRRRNYRALIEEIKKIKGVRPLFPDLPDGVCPYVFPIVLETPSVPVASRLELAGIPGFVWPELPEAIAVNSDLNREVQDLRDHILLLPVHQDLDDADIKDIVLNVRSAVMG